jgi:uncharacterized GH25 family protein
MVLFLTLVAVVTLAHDTWLIPQRSAVPAGSTVILDLTSGMSFPLLDHAIAPDRVDTALVRLAAKTSAIDSKQTSPKSLRLTTSLKESGVATVWVVLKSKSLELTPKLVAEYLDEIGASPEIRQKWAAAKPQRWREIYTKHAKTFVAVGTTGGDRSWAEPVGMALEIVPEVDPAALHAGAELPVRVLKNGQPFAGFPIGVAGPGNAKGTIQRTDGQGRTTFKLPRAGTWLLRGTDLWASTKPDTEWESAFTTLTLQVR